MADYWVSQNRKYCDFCKCWITDNRPSVDFHEKGRRHQENVKKKLRTITRHSTKVHKDNTKLDATLRVMETAALESYRKDIETNGDITSMAIKKKLLESGGGPIPTKLWNEKRTRDGKTYYENIMTKQTVWTPPPEGYMSMQEQHDQAHEEAQKQLKALEKYKRKEALLTMQEIKQQEAEDRAREFREKMKERQVSNEIVTTTCGPLLEPGKTNPYGRWQTVSERPLVDYQLPQLPEYYEPLVEYEPEPIVKEFKEKQVQSLDVDDEESSSTSTAFKKRKIGEGAKRNTRQRLEDD